MVGQLPSLVPELTTESIIKTSSPWKTNFVRLVIWRIHSKLHHYDLICFLWFVSHLYRHHTALCEQLYLSEGGGTLTSWTASGKFPHSSPSWSQEYWSEIKQRHHKQCKVCFGLTHSETRIHALSPASWLFLLELPTSSSSPIVTLGGSEISRSHMCGSSSLMYEGLYILPSTGGCLVCTF